jgi:hypothetical protein
MRKTAVVIAMATSASDSKAIVVGIIDRLHKTLDLLHLDR